MASAHTIESVHKILKSHKDGGKLIVVVSALGGVTNELLKIGQLAANGSNYDNELKALRKRHLQVAKGLIPSSKKSLDQDIKQLFDQLEDICKGIFWIKELTLKTQDYLLSFGESLSSRIITEYFRAKRSKALRLDSSKIIKTDSQFGNARVDFEKTNRLIRKEVKQEADILVVPGFIASNDKGEITTLGRGGSDYTAAIIAAAVKAKSLEIWTDVDGLMTADPRFVRSAHSINSISYEDAMELSHFGAKVIYPPTIQPVLDRNIPIKIKNTFNPGHSGTTIHFQESTSNGRVVKGLSSIQGIALVNIKGSGMVGIPNISHRLFRSLASEKVNIILITQASSEHSISIGIDQTDISLAKAAIEEEFQHELNSHKIDPVEIEDGLTIVALVGSKMRQQAGVSGRLFSTLGNNGVNIKAIAQGSSERNISVVIDSHNIKKALNSLHESFFLSETKRVNLFIVGVGNVGSAFLEQIRKQEKTLSDLHHLKLRVVGLANSRFMSFNEDGIDLKSWKKTLGRSRTKFSIDDFREKIFRMNLRNSIFIDNTASPEIAECYLELLNQSISVVTPNKIACSSSYEKYLELKNTATKKNQKFLFETNVGAGLPIISTLNDLVKSGDRIKRIEAVLSGSLNFIFNNYDGEKTFKDIVQQAMDEGYTEPDPRIDLSGVDVQRKILILIRESGLPMELKDIQSNDFIPASIMKSRNVDEFLNKLVKNEDTFRALLEKAGNRQLKYVASYKPGKASTGLEFIKEGHPFYNLEGKDNIVLFYTERYSDQPLVVKGAGAGAEVTASGIFADVMRYANK